VLCREGRRPGRPTGSAAARSEISLDCDSRGARSASGRHRRHGFRRPVSPLARVVVVVVVAARGTGNGAPGPRARCTNGTT
jgi:hypothetical protein